METPKAICKKCIHVRTYGCHVEMYCCSEPSNCEISPITGDILCQDCRHLNANGNCKKFEEITPGKTILSWLKGLFE